MKWEQNCPKCGLPPHGTMERLVGLALLNQDGADGFVYDGYTEVYWHDQRTMHDADGRDALICENDHEWFSYRSE